MSHEGEGRGLLPSGLVEEIRALAQPPISWDVQLARWFAERFPLVEPVRTYARLSRRQAATPDIPRPSRVPPIVEGPNKVCEVSLKVCSVSRSPSASWSTRSLRPCLA